MEWKTMPRYLAVCIVWISILSTGCDNALLRDDLEAIRTRGHLIMITRNNAASYYEDSYGPSGFEYDLVKAFADYLEVGLKTLILENEADMVAALGRGDGDIIAAGLPFGEQATRFMAMGPPYMKIQHSLIGRRDGPSIRSIEDVADNTIWISPSSSHIELLKELRAEFEDLNWRILKDLDSESALELVWNHSVPLTVAESNIFKLNRPFFPELVIQLKLGPVRHLAWAMNPASRHLRKAVRHWFLQPSTREYIDGLINHYFSHLNEFDYVDLVRFGQRIDSRLPEYRPFFEAAAEKYGFDWQMVASQSYQESHWNPRAKSFTGVRGIMMVTQETAKALGLANRLAAEEGIYAGTQYLARLHRQLDDIPEPDRTFMALAAYNLGMGHIKDAQTLADEMGKATNKWRTIRSILPLLQQKKYYKKLYYGYARGTEAVQYVDHIRTYHSVLKKIVRDGRDNENPNEAAGP